MAYKNVLGHADGTWRVVLSDEYVIGRWREQAQAEAHAGEARALDPEADISVYSSEEWGDHVPF